jgi:hypothetical protein
MASKRLDEEVELARALVDDLERELKALQRSKAKTSSAPKAKAELETQLRAQLESAILALEAAEQAAALGRDTEAFARVPAPVPLSETMDNARVPGAPDTDSDEATHSHRSYPTHEGVATLEAFRSSSSDSQDSQRLVVMARSKEGGTLTSKSYVTAAEALQHVNSGTDEFMRISAVLCAAQTPVQVKVLVHTAALPLERVLATLRRMLDLKLVTLS